MKICPHCSATARDEHVVCPVDGAALVALSTAMTLPARSTAERSCPGCGARRVEEDDGPCQQCGDLRLGTRSTLPGRGGMKVSDLTLMSEHGEGGFLVTDGEGRSRFLVFGAEEAMVDEARALGTPSGVFPSVVQEGRTTEVGHFAVLTADLEGASPISDVLHSFEEGLALVRAVLDAAAELEARGFTWEPSPSDLYVRPDGRLLAVRARGARRRLADEPLNAKRVLEALGDALLPAPIVRGTPELLRLLVPRWNFSTVATRSIDGAREDVARAETAFLTKGDSTLANLCDPGLRRHHNEDAVALERGERDGEPFQVMVVCDGVSSSTHAERASAIASEVARDAIADFARTGDMTGGAARGVEDAIRAAHAAICAENIDYGDGSPPGTTLVAALLFGRTLTVGWVGDSRAYWVSEAGSELCTTDHSWINDVTANGGLSVAEAMQSPLAHALTRCLGPLDRGDGVVQDVLPDVRQRALAGPGHVVLCTDGLWNYFPSASAIADLVRGAGTGADASAIARFLVCSALAEGGGDNVSVAVHALAAPSGTE